MDLTPDQEAEALRIFESLKGKADAELMAVARLLASRETGELFGRTEFEVRERVHAIGAKALESALAGRKKGGTSAVASPAATATGRPASSGTRPGGS
jgi:predicted GNAT family N-acyltransferase